MHKGQACLWEVGALFSSLHVLHVREAQPGPGRQATEGQDRRVRNCKEFSPPPEPGTGLAAWKVLPECLQGKQTQHTPCQAVNQNQGRGNTSVDKERRKKPGPRQTGQGPGVYITAAEGQGMGKPASTVEHWLDVPPSDICIPSGTV